MTTALPSQDLGRQFIHRVSRLAYSDELRFARWRSKHDGPSASPDLTYWTGISEPAAPIP
jgi:hypothetical protein